MIDSNLILETNSINSNVIQNYENNEGSNSYEENCLLKNTKEVSIEDSHDEIITKKIQKRKNVDKDDEIDNQEINNFNKRSKRIRNKCLCSKFFDQSNEDYAIDLFYGNSRINSN